jgi:hypothetical protein
MGQLNLKSYLSSVARKAPTAEQAKLATTLNEEAAENWGDPRWHKEQAALISQAVDFGLTNPEVFRGVLRFQALGANDKLIYRERRGVKVYASAQGGYVDESTISTDSFEAPRSPLAWHVVASEDDFLADYAEQLSTLVDLAKKAEQAELVRRQLVLLQAAVPSSSPYYVDATSSGLTATVLNAAIRGVADAERPNGGILPTAITVIGRAAGVDKINDFTGFTFSQNQLDEINNSGNLGRYRGARVQRLLNFTDGDGVSFMSENEVWVVSDDAGDFATFGGSRVNTWTENELDKTHTKSRRDVGGYVARPQNVRRIVLA